MPATPTRAAFIRQEYRVVKSGPNASVEAIWGKLARRTTEPFPTFFETEADAQAICTARMDLLSSPSRRVVQVAQGEQSGLAIDYISGSPTVTVIDDELEILGPMLVSEIKISFGNQSTTLETWGSGTGGSYRITDIADIRSLEGGDLRTWG